MILKNSLFYIIFILGYINLAFPQFISPPSEAFGDQLTIGCVESPIRYINPFDITNSTEKQIARLMFGKGLIQRPDRFSQSAPLVDVYRYPGSNKYQGLIWSYTLRRNINFHNGVPLRNSDVKFTFEMLKKWGGHIINRDIDFSNIESIEVGGDLEVRFNLKQKDNEFDLKFSDIPILSQNYYRDFSRLGFNIFRQVKPFGYGPFQFKRITPKEIILESHPHYVFGTPFLNRIVYKFYDDELQLIDDFIQGNIDLIEVKERITAERLSQILKNEIRIFPTPRPEKKVYYVLFNVNQHPFQNRQIRTAVRSAINPTEIINRLIDQKGRIAYSIIDNTSPVFFDDLPRDVYQPELSMNILRRNGWQTNSSRGTLEKDGEDLNFELLFQQNSYLEESIARAIKIHLAEIGINLQPRPVSFREKQQLIEENKFTAVIDNYTYYEEDNFSGVKKFYTEVLKNNGAQVNYKNPILDRLFKESNKEQERREMIIKRFQIFLHQDVPVVFLYFDDKIIYAVKNRFQNIRVSYSSDKIYYHRLNPFENWYVPKALQKYPAW